MVSMHGLARAAMRGTVVDVRGLRKERIFVWNKDNHKWDEQDMNIWFRDKEGKETLFKRTKRENDHNDIK